MISSTVCQQMLHQICYLLTAKFNLSWHLKYFALPCPVLPFVVLPCPSLSRPSLLITYNSKEWNFNRITVLCVRVGTRNWGHGIREVQYNSMFHKSPPKTIQTNLIYNIVIFTGIVTNVFLLNEKFFNL